MQASTVTNISPLSEDKSTNPPTVSCTIISFVLAAIHFAMNISEAGFVVKRQKAKCPGFNAPSRLLLRC
jgi:hypothetical protein